MILTGLNHLAFITPSMEKTIRFYRDLLEMDLVSGIGQPGFRHYFFKCGEGAVAFFEYSGAQPMKYDKSHGSPTSQPIGFDHVSFTVASCEELFGLRDKLVAANVEVSEAVDHGTIWSIYFFDPVNHLPLEASWNCMEVTKPPAILDTKPLKVAEEGSGPQPGQWPEVSTPTGRSQMVAKPGNGFDMRAEFLQRGLAKVEPHFATLTKSQSA
jgi:catechol 2,3-dioxygenase-like lactoylglutathione lyase family enzyme